MANKYIADSEAPTGEKFYAEFDTKAKVDLYVRGLPSNWKIKITTRTDQDDAVVLKAFNGNRSQNLESIADKIDSLLTEHGKTMPLQIVHQIKGYMEQLRIIADELNPTTEFPSQDE